MMVLRYCVSPDAPGRKWAVKAVIAGPEGKEIYGDHPTYFQSKREAKAEKERRNAELAEIRMRSAIKLDIKAI